MHLKDEELLDLAEGTLDEGAVPHLASCAVCRSELADLRGMLSVAAAAGMPEPSPLFWDHLSARVKQDVAAEAAGVGPSWMRHWLSWKIAAPVAASLVVLLAVTVALRRTPSPVAEPAPAAAIATATIESAVGQADDPSWSFVADLASDLDWDAAIEAGIGAPAGGVDRAVFDLSADERRELQRLVQEELARTGA